MSLETPYLTNVLVLLQRFLRWLHMVGTFEGLMDN